MDRKEASVQRAFRLSRSTSDLLDAAARTSGETRNAIADRLLGEAVRMDRHPLIRFRTGAAGRREPLLVGTRLLVRQVVQTVRDHDGDVDAGGAYLDVPARMVRAAVSYYAEFSDDVDADTRWAADVAADEQLRWEREQAALA
ncbi:MAG TPA: hypothetical protein VFD41_15830 [Actinomycetales bacterium]|nr:hypothetical protein [Actinomycetales bacterium]